MVNNSYTEKSISSPHSNVVNGSHTRKISSYIYGKRDANENHLETQSAHSYWEFTREAVGKRTLCTRLVQMYTGDLGGELWSAAWKHLSRHTHISTFHSSLHLTAVLSAREMTYVLGGPLKYCFNILRS